MADHWKTLANRLGTPGIDEPEVEEIKEEKSAPEAPSSASAARSADFESKPAAKKPAFEKALGGPPPVESPALAPEPVEEPVKPAKRKSSWETLASLFNV